MCASCRVICDYFSSRAGEEAAWGASGCGHLDRWQRLCLLPTCVHDGSGRSRGRCCGAATSVCTICVPVTAHNARVSGSSLCKHQTRHRQSYLKYKDTVVKRFMSFVFAHKPVRASAGGAGRGPRVLDSIIFSGGDRSDPRPEVQEWHPAGTMPQAHRERVLPP